MGFENMFGGNTPELVQAAPCDGERVVHGIVVEFVQVLHGTRGTQHAAVHRPLLPDM